MRKLSLLLLAGTFLTACVDKDYDLNDIDTDDITIGDETSVFRMPLATVKIGMSELNENGTDIRDIFREADVWLPTELDGDYADLKRLLANDTDYIDGLLDDLTAEMMTSDTKLRTVTDEIWSNPNYKASFENLVPGITSDVTNDEFHTAFREVFLNEPVMREQLGVEVARLARGYLTDLRVEELRYEIDGLELGSDVVDMLTKNLDPEAKPGEKNTLCLYGQIASKLPISMKISPQFTPTDVACDVSVDALKASNPIEETQLFEEDLRQIVEGVTIVIPVTLERYYRDLGFDETATEPQLVIDLRVVKRGGLTLNL